MELPTNRHIHNGRDEFLELAKSSGLNVIKDLKVTRNNAKAKYFIAREIRLITKLPNSEQSYKGKVKTHMYINRQNQSTTGKL